MIYIGTPYSHPDPKVVEDRYDFIANYCAEEVSKGLVVFSPIVYGHNLIKFKEMPGDYIFWQNFCIQFLKLSVELHVLMMEGWEKSNGLKEEIRVAKELFMNIKYIEIKK
jgi:hypothetical protein